MADSTWGDFLADAVQDASAQTEEATADPAVATAPGAPDEPETPDAQLADDGSPIATDDGSPIATDDGSPIATDDGSPITTDDGSTGPDGADDGSPIATGDGSTGPDGASTAEAAATPDAIPVTDAEAASWEAWSQQDMVQAEVLTEIASEHLQAASEWAALGNVEEAREELAQAELAAEMAHVEGSMASMEREMAEAHLAEGQGLTGASDGTGSDWDSFGAGTADAGLAETADATQPESGLEGGSFDAGSTQEGYETGNYDQPAEPDNSNDGDGFDGGNPF